MSEKSANYLEYISKIYPVLEIENQPKLQLTQLQLNAAVQVMNQILATEVLPQMAQPEVIEKWQQTDIESDKPGPAFIDKWQARVPSPLAFFPFLPEGYNLRYVNTGFYLAAYNALAKNAEDSSLVPGGRGVVAEIATSGGKTAMAATLIASLPPNSKTVFVCPSIQLANQIIMEIKQFLPGRAVQYDFSNPNELVQDEFDKFGANTESGNPEPEVIVAVIDSFTKNHKLYPKIDFLVVDESHKIVNSPSYKTAFSDIGKPPHILFSATPIPLYIQPQKGFIPVISGISLMYMDPKTMLSEEIIYSYKAIDGIKRGELAPLSWKTLKTNLLNDLAADSEQEVDNNGENKIGSDGDLKQQVIDNVVEANFNGLMDILAGEINANLSEWNNTWSMYASNSVDLAINGAELIHQKTGLTTVAVSSNKGCFVFENGKKTMLRFNEAVKYFEQKPGSIIFQVGTLTEGYSFKPLTNLIMGNPSFRVDKIIQLIGRVLRKDENNPEKVAKVLTFSPEIYKFYLPVSIAQVLGFPDSVDGYVGPTDKQTRTGKNEIDNSNVERSLVFNAQDIFYKKFESFLDFWERVEPQLKVIGKSATQLKYEMMELIATEMNKFDCQQQYFKIIKDDDLEYFNPVITMRMELKIQAEYTEKITQDPMFSSFTDVVSLSHKFGISTSEILHIIMLGFRDDYDKIIKDKYGLINFVPNDLVNPLESYIWTLRQNHVNNLDIDTYFNKQFFNYPEEIKKLVVRFIVEQNLPGFPSSSIDYSSKFWAIDKDFNSLKMIVPADFTAIINGLAVQTFEKSENMLNFRSRDERLRGINFKSLNEILKELGIYYLVQNPMTTQTNKVLPREIEIDGKTISVLKLIQDKIDEYIEVPPNLVSLADLKLKNIQITDEISKNFIKKYKPAKFLFLDSAGNYNFDYGIPEEDFDLFVRNIETALDAQQNYKQLRVEILTAVEYLSQSPASMGDLGKVMKHLTNRAKVVFGSTLKLLIESDPEYFSQNNYGYIDPVLNQACFTPIYGKFLQNQIKFWNDGADVRSLFEEYLKLNNLNSWQLSTVLNTKLYLHPEEFKEVQVEFHKFVLLYKPKDTDIIESQLPKSLPNSIKAKLDEQSVASVSLKDDKYKIIKNYTPQAHEAAIKEHKIFNKHNILFSKLISISQKYILNERKVSLTNIYSQFCKESNLESGLMPTRMVESQDAYIPKQQMAAFKEYLSKYIEAKCNIKIIQSEFHHRLSQRFANTNFAAIAPWCKRNKIDLESIDTLPKLGNVIEIIELRLSDLNKDKISFDTIFNQVNKQKTTSRQRFDKIAQTYLDTRPASSTSFLNRNFTLSQGINIAEQNDFLEFYNSQTSLAKSENGNGFVEIPKASSKAFTDFIIKIRSHSQLKNLDFTKLVKSQNGKMEIHQVLAEAFKYSSNFETVARILAPLLNPEQK